MKRIYMLAALVPMFLSCVTSLEKSETEDSESVQESYHIRVEMEQPCDAAVSRSSFTEEEINRINDLNIFVYHDGLLLDEHSRYFTDMSELMLSFPFDKDGFNIYMVGNVGKIDAPADESQIDRICHVAEDYDDFRTSGFPVANVFPDYRKGTLAVFRLKRLVGQYNIGLRPTATDARYVVKDVRLMNCALDVYPFSTDTRASHFAGKGAYGDKAAGDVLTAEDIENLNAGRQVSLYFVENLQGVLLPDNEDRRKKIPSSLDNVASGLSSCCTYLEVTADIITPAARYTDGKYRFYLGRDETTDFSIVRNTLYNVILDFTQNMVNEEEWRIEVGKPQVEEVVLSKTEMHVVRGTRDHVLIYGPRVCVDEERNIEQTDDLMWKLEDVTVDGVRCQKLSFETKCDIIGMYSWGADHKSYALKRNIALETVECYNGNPLIVRNLTVYVHDRVFPVFIRMGSNGNSAPYQLEAVTDAPINYNLLLSASLRADIDNSGSVRVYAGGGSVMSVTEEGYGLCYTRFPSLYNSGFAKPVYFKEMSVVLKGKTNECCNATEMYMGSGGEEYWGPGAGRYPAKFPDLEDGGDLDANFVHSCSVAGCVRYTVSSGNSPLFVMAPSAKTCGTARTTGTSNSRTYDIDAYNTESYIPFYVVNGDLSYAYPVTLLDESARYLDDSARKSIIYEMNGPGRDVFYPNGVVWGSDSEKSPDNKHRFGFTAGLTKQVFGNIHTWQIYQDYECDFYMTVNGCTSWPGASGLSSGFQLAYNL